MRARATVLIIFLACTFTLHSQSYKLMPYKGYFYDCAVNFGPSTYPLSFSFISTHEKFDKVGEDLSVDSLINVIVANDTLVPVMLNSAYRRVFPQVYKFSDELEINSFNFYNNLDSTNKREWCCHLKQRAKLEICRYSFYGILYMPDAGNNILKENASNGLDFCSKYSSAKLCLPLMMHPTKAF